jgi:demethylmenaquinone methyltransferase/2-methoxy-6-polyprenyl-1,4-benzoquinol methylase
MSTYVLMRILESAPYRYELGIKMLTLGSLGKAYDRLADRVEEGQRVLDVGCGTGCLTLRAARRGARVIGIDVNPEMLAIASRRVQAEGLSKRIELREMGIAEMDAVNAESYNVVMSGLCFSELGESEIAYALRESRRILEPGGLLMIADEIRPSRLLARTAHTLIRIPLAALAYFVTGQTTQALDGLPDRVTEAGFSIESVRTSAMGSFMELVARKPRHSGS